jgi:hypothetical protein
VTTTLNGEADMSERAPDSLVDFLAQTTEVERRRTVRYASDEEALCRPGGAPGEARWARVVDVSAGGLGLLLGEPQWPGELLVLEFPWALSAAGHLVRARVAHCTQRADGSWLVGCCFNYPLGADDLQALARL